MNIGSLVDVANSHKTRRTIWIFFFLSLFIASSGADLTLLDKIFSLTDSDGRELPLIISNQKMGFVLFCIQIFLLVNLILSWLIDRRDYENEWRGLNHDPSEVRRDIKALDEMLMKFKEIEPKMNEEDVRFPVALADEVRQNLEKTNALLKNALGWDPRSGENLENHPTIEELQNFILKEMENGNLLNTLSDLRESLLRARETHNVLQEFGNIIPDKTKVRSSLEMARTTYNWSRSAKRFQLHVVELVLPAIMCTYGIVITFPLAMKFWIP